MKVWMVDPSAMTIYYDIALTMALKRAGLDVRLLTSRFLYEDKVPYASENAEYTFFRPFDRWSSVLRNRRLTRRLARVVAYPFDLVRLYRELAQSPPTLLHVQWTLLPQVDRIIFGHFSKSVPIVLTLHDPVPHDAALATLSDMRPLVEVAARVIVHAEENRLALLSKFPHLDERVVVIPFGPLLEEQPMPERTDALDKLEIDQSAKIILFFGAIKRYKGLATLIRAMPQILAACPNAHLLVAGQPEGEAQPYLDLVRELNIGHACTMHFTYVPTDEVSTYFAASDVVCLPYSGATQSGVLLTAYRFGRAVVATRVGGLAESVEDGENGYVVNPNDIDELGTAVSSLLIDEELRISFGVRSAALAVSKFGWDRTSNLTIQAYGDAQRDWAAARY